MIRLLVLLAVVAGAAPAAAWKPPDDLERSLVERALRCPNAKRVYRDPFLLLELLRLEEHPDIAVPAKWRGMTLSGACNESGYSMLAIGDGGLAIGLTQLHRWHRNRCGLSVEEAMHPIANARCWLWRIRRSYDCKARRKCGARRGWTAAWAWVAQGPRGYRCRAWSRGHMSRLRRWRPRRPVEELVERFDPARPPVPDVIVSHRATFSAWGP